MANKRLNSPTIEEITKSELYALESNDRISKLERDLVRDRKVIEEFKNREKSSARALILYERKIRFIKQTVTNALLKICKNIDISKDSLIHDEDKNDIADDLELAMEEIFDVCNNLEINSAISKSDRDFILNVQPKKQSSQSDTASRFDKLKEEFNQKIGSSVSRKRGRPKKSEQSIVADIGLGKKSKEVAVAYEKPIKTDKNVEKKLSQLFYDAPTDEKVNSGIPQTDESLFDFDEALNPNISLKDIMADIMAEPKENQKVKVYDATSIGKAVKIERKHEKSKTKIDMLESGFINSPKITKKQK